MNELRESRILFFCVIAFFSLIFSLDASVRGAAINPDGICYLQSAEAMLSMPIQSAMHLCGQAQWPFYSILMYGLVSVTHVSFINAAFILNALFSLISVFSFIGIVKGLGANQRTVWLAAVVILLAHEFNSVREYVIRDHGFWAFYLLSIALLVQFFHHLKSTFAWGWSLALLVATAFRIEGALFLLGLPWMVWFISQVTWPQKIRAFLYLNAPLFLLVVLFFLFKQSSGAEAHLSRVAEIQFQLTHGMQQLMGSFMRASQGLSEHVLSIYSAHDAGFILSLMLVSWYMATLATNLSLIYTALVIYAWVVSSIRFTQRSKLVLLGYLAINAMITSLFLVENLFLSKRYVLAFTLTLMVWVPFALNDLIEKCQHRVRWLFLVAVLIIMTSLGGIIDFGYSKTYVRHAGEWLAVHVPANAKLYSNDPQVMYYSKHFGNTIFVTSKEYEQINLLDHKKWQQFDFIALHLKAHDRAQNTVITNEISLLPLHVFANKRGDQVIIYHIEH